MKRGAKCYACNKQINHNSEFRIGQLGYATFYYRIFHKNCFRDYQTKGKYIYQIQKRTRRFILHVPVKSFWYNLGMYNLNTIHVPVKSFWYNLGMYNLNTINFWFLALVFSALFGFLFYYLIPLNFFYFVLSLIIVQLLYHLITLLYFYKKDVW